MIDQQKYNSTTDIAHKYSKEANKTLHPTARSHLVEVSIINFTAPPPFPRSPPLLAVDELLRCARYEDTTSTRGGSRVRIFLGIFGRALCCQTRLVI